MRRERGHSSQLQDQVKYFYNQTKVTLIIKGLFGFGTTASAVGVPTFMFSIMDKVEVPADIVPGEYVLSFRWDCEQTPQIWTNCANIKIVSDKV